VPGWRDTLKTKKHISRRIKLACMPEMQEQFPAGAWMARQFETKGISVGPHAETAGAFFDGCLSKRQA
jgi:hypothetical protein